MVVHLDVLDYRSQPRAMALDKNDSFHLAEILASFGLNSSMKHCTVCKGKYDDSVSFCPVDGEVLEDDPSSIVGSVLDGQYQIDSMLGKGGMGAVYRARHILLGDRVAIKILPPEVRTCHQS